jgi:hypothetical protein
MRSIRTTRPRWEALYWVRALINPLLESSHDKATGFMDIKLVIHWTELVMLAKRSYAKYRERMHYYPGLGREGFCLRFKRLASSAELGNHARPTLPGVSFDSGVSHPA